MNIPEKRKWFLATALWTLVTAYFWAFISFNFQDIFTFISCEGLGCAPLVLLLLALGALVILSVPLYVYKVKHPGEKNTKMLIGIFLTGVLSLFLSYLGTVIPQEISTVIEKQRIAKGETNFIAESIFIKTWEEDQEGLLIAELGLDVDFQEIGKYTVSCWIIDPVYMVSAIYSDVSFPGKQTFDCVIKFGLYERLYEIDYGKLYKQGTERNVIITLEKTLPNQYQATVDTIGVVIDENGSILAVKKDITLGEELQKSYEKWRIIRKNSGAVPPTL